ncbi:MAG: DegV family protein [Dehalococcoidia bacterium]|nr:DegV family protein [Dehalococcoidia bacterium]
MTLRIVTDSTCDLPPDLLRDLNVTVVPCNLHFGTDVLRDSVDITPPQFYQRLASAKALPTTSQPSVGLFLETYRRLAGEATEVLSLHISQKLSGTHASAVQAVAELASPLRVQVVDSTQVSLGLGFLVREAARMARDGATLGQAHAFLRDAIPAMRSYVTVDTLGYLVRGGRASRMQGFFAGMLDIKPIIVVRDGETHPAGRVRSRRRAMQSFQEIAAQAGKLRALGFMQAACLADAAALADSCSSIFPRADMLIREFTPVMGAHLGPGALGMALWPGSPP